MAKKIAVLVRERQAEALRMGVGIILLDDRVDVYVLDRPVEESEDNVLNLETMAELGMKIFSTTKENENMEFVSPEALADRLLDYDHIVPY